MDFEQLTLTEIVQLQTQLSEIVKRRFERNQALGFSDVVNSTPYFATFGDEAGRRLQQLHIDLINQVLPKYRGRIVDTAGDGAFTAFPSADEACGAFTELQELISKTNRLRAREHQLEVRVGIHWGPVLTDGTVVTGDSVNLCSRITGTAKGSEIRLSKSAFSELSKDKRLRCIGLAPVMLKGVLRPVEIMQLEWLDRSRFPTRVRVKETNEEIVLPPQDTVTFGRLREQNGILANDVVLAVPDKTSTQQVSRWHFELRRLPEGFVLRSVTDQFTEVDGKPITKGQEVSIRPNSVVFVARVMTLEFLPDPLDVRANEGADATMNFQALNLQMPKPSGS